MFTSFNTNRMALSAEKPYESLNRHSDATLESTASGLSINHASEDPAKFWWSEKLRGHLASLKQTQQTSQTAINYVQTVEQGLEQILANLNRAKTVAVHAANDGTLDEAGRAMDQDEIDRQLQEIDSIVNSLSFASKKIFKNSSLVGQSSDPAFTVRSVSAATQASEEGYQIEVQQYPTKAQITTNVELSPIERVGNPWELTFLSGVKKATFKMAAQDTFDKLDTRLNQFFAAQELPLAASLDKNSHLKIEATEYGSAASFQVQSNLPDFFAGTEGQFFPSQAGLDIIATVGGEQATGQGNHLVGKKGGKTDGLELEWQEPKEEPAKASEENPAPLLVKVSQDPLSFHIEKDQGGFVQFYLPQLNTDQLSKNIPNASQYKSLREIKVSDFSHAEDSLLLINQATNELSKLRGKLGAFQKDYLEWAQQTQMATSQDYQTGESAIRDADMAKNLADVTRQKLQIASAGDVLQNSHMDQRAYLRLLRGP